MGLQAEHPKVKISADARNKLDFYIAAAPQEIQGYGLVEAVSPSEFLITDVFTFEQEASSASTDVSGEDLAKGLYELIQRGVDTENIRLWWHSHVNMQSHFSNTDYETMKDTWDDTTYFISIVGNKRGEYNVRVDMYNPMRAFIDGIDLTTDVVNRPPLPIIRYCAAFGCLEHFETDASKQSTKFYCEKHWAEHEAIIAEVEAKVHKPKYTAPKAGAYSTKDGWKRPQTLEESRRERHGHLNGSKGSESTRPDGYWDDFLSMKYCNKPSCLHRVPVSERFCEDHAPKDGEKNSSMCNAEDSVGNCPRVSIENFAYGDLRFCWEHWRLVKLIDENWHEDIKDYEEDIMIPLVGFAEEILLLQVGGDESKVNLTLIEELFKHSKFKELMDEELLTLLLESDDNDENASGSSSIIIIGDEKKSLPPSKEEAKAEKPTPPKRQRTTKTVADAADPKDATAASTEVEVQKQKRGSRRSTAKKPATTTK